jgi:hypothetical protein
VAIGILGILLVLATCGIIGLAFVQGSWWYAVGGDQALSQESRACVEAIREQVAASSEVPEAIVWLDAALEPRTHPTDVRAYLIEAQEMLEAADIGRASVDDPGLAEAAAELQSIIDTIRGGSFEKRATPYVLSTPEWP